MCRQIIFLEKSNVKEEESDPVLNFLSVLLSVDDIEGIED